MSTSSRESGAPDPRSWDAPRFEPRTATDLDASIWEMPETDSTRLPWEPGTASGIGSLPGTDVVEAVKTVFGDLPDLPHLPELPARGPGADMIGRSAGLLIDMPVELYAARWRVAAHRGQDARRTRDLWERDLDALTDHAGAFEGPVKTQIAGVWTLAASVDLPVGGRVLRDPGAVRDLTASLAEGIIVHVAQLQARLPYARIVLQLDEPSLPAVLAGAVPTESGYGRLPAIAVDVARDALAQVIAAAGVPVIVHCCAVKPPVRLIRDTGAAAAAVDLDYATDYDALGEVLESGLGLLAGAIDARSATPATAESVAARVRDLWKIIGFSVNTLPEQVVVTPACGLAGVSPNAARAAMKVARDAARRLADS